MPNWANEPPRFSTSIVRKPSPLRTVMGSASDRMPLAFGDDRDFLAIIAAQLDLARDVVDRQLRRLRRCGGGSRSGWGSAPGSHSVPGITHCCSLRGCSRATVSACGALWLCCVQSPRRSIGSPRRPAAACSAVSSWRARRSRIDAARLGIDDWRCTAQRAAAPADGRAVGQIQGAEQRLDAVANRWVRDAQLALELAQVAARAQERFEQRVLLAVESAEAADGEFALDRRAARVAMQPRNCERAVANRASRDHFSLHLLDLIPSLLCPMPRTVKLFFHFVKSDINFVKLRLCQHRLVSADGSQVNGPRALVDLATHMARLVECVPNFSEGRDTRRRRRHRSARVAHARRASARSDVRSRPQPQRADLRRRGRAR